MLLQFQGRQTTVPTHAASSEPRISLNALADYLTSAAGRRRSIVSEQKRPKVFQVSYYTEAEKAIARSIAGGDFDEGHLDRAIETLTKDIPKKDWERTRRETGVEAIESFRTMGRKGTIDISGMERSPAQLAPLPIEGLRISVRPEILVRTAGQVVGCAKLYFSKTERMTAERAGYAGTLVHQYVETLLATGANTRVARCLVIDVFGQSVWKAPRTCRRKRQDIAAACGEISLMWQRA